jgi:hypothetical protein
MKIRIPVRQLVALLGKVIKAAPGGISKEEATALGTELLEIALSILGTSLPEHVEVG